MILIVSSTLWQDIMSIKMQLLFRKVQCLTTICDWIWQNLASMHRATLGDMAISSIYCIAASWWIVLKKWKLQQVLVYSLAIIVWVNNFQAPEIQAVLNSFFMTVMILQLVVIGVVGGGGGWA